MRILSIAAAMLFTTSVWLVSHTAQASTEPVKIILLSGQSNMVGHGKSEMGRDPGSPYVRGESSVEIKGGLGSLRAMVNDHPDTFGHSGTNPLVDRQGNWIVRKDVFIHKETKGHIRTGGHTIGFGTNNAWIGPEYGFGQVVGNALDQDVVLIKIAWGGKSLDVDFTSPTAAARRGTEVGEYWTAMVRDMKKALKNIETLFPELAGRKFEVSGFGWHQGWNDRINNDFTARYEANMADFIKDVRAKFGQDLPFVIANTGLVPDAKQAGPLLAAQNAMADFEKYPKHMGNVAVVDTTVLWRGPEVSPSDKGYHWNHNGMAHYEVGAGMGEAYLKMVDQR